MNKGRVVIFDPPAAAAFSDRRTIAKLDDRAFLAEMRRRVREGLPLAEGGAASASWYANGLLGMFSATAARKIDWVNDTIKAMLLTASYTPNTDTDTFYSDISANEVANGNGYTTGGVALAGKSTSYDASSKEVRLLASASSWANSSFSYRYAALYKDTGAGATSPLLGLVDAGGTESVTLATVTITWDTTHGALKLVLV